METLVDSFEKKPEHLLPVRPYLKIFSYAATKYLQYNLSTASTQGNWQEKAGRVFDMNLFSKDRSSIFGSVMGEEKSIPGIE